MTPACSHDQNGVAFYLLKFIQVLKCNLCHYCRGENVSIENFHQGFTHVFESTFDSTEGIAEYIDHPTHVEYANILLPQLEKVLVIDYKPEKVGP